jgi:peptide-methionine (S)-S-oxide reductase
MELATFAAGCFWGVEEKFRTLTGVQKTRVGYTGGKTDNPNWYAVCTDTTGHAEAVEIEFDPAQISYQELLEIFWNNHNPTSLNFQGPDYGTQYRSAIFFHTPEQEKLALASKENLIKTTKYKLPIVTEIVPAQTFWLAEEHHQQFLAKRGQTSCRIY